MRKGQRELGQSQRGFKVSVEMPTEYPLAKANLFTDNLAAYNHSREIFPTISLLVQDSRFATCCKLWFCLC